VHHPAQVAVGVARELRQPDVADAVLRVDDVVPGILGGALEAQDRLDLEPVPCAQARYVGFTVPAVPLAGYGVDYLGHYRHLPHIASLVRVEKGSRGRPNLAYS